MMLTGLNFAARTWNQHTRQETLLMGISSVNGFHSRLYLEKRRDAKKVKTTYASFVSRAVLQNNPVNINEATSIQPSKFT